MEEGKEIIIDGNHPLMNKEGLFFKEFPSDIRQVRFFSMLIVQKAPPEIKEINLLEQQISELIKNAVRHGNKNDINKKVKVWAGFSTDHAHVIVEDEGDGFSKLEEWNEFNKKRNECFANQDFEEMEKYFSFRTEESTEMTEETPCLLHSSIGTEVLFSRKRKTASLFTKTSGRRNTDWNSNSNYSGRA